MVTYVLSFTFVRLHSFIFFVTSPFLENYAFYQKRQGLQYNLGALVGILLVGALLGNLLANRV